MGDEEEERTVHWPDERRGSPLVSAISPRRLALMWDVDVQTVYRDIRKGALPAFRLPGGDLRIRLSDARRYGKPARRD